MAVHKMSAREARANFADLLGQVFYTGEPVVIEKKGRPFAVVVNPEEYEAFRKERDEAFAVIDRIRERNATRDAEEVEREVTAVVEAVRKERDERRRKGAAGRR